MCTEIRPTTEAEASVETVSAQAEDGLGGSGSYTEALSEPSRDNEIATVSNHINTRRRGRRRDPRIAGDPLQHPQKWVNFAVAAEYLEITAAR